MKVLIADDHSIVRLGLRRLLAVEPRIDIVEVADGQSVVNAFRESRPDLVILDLNLPDISGLEVLARLRSENDGVRVLIISMYASPVHVARALEAGARGYVSKSATPEQMLEGIRRVAVGRTYIEHEIAQELAMWNIRDSSQPLKNLSARDVEILRLLAEGSSLNEIARLIGVSYKTVANHCTQLRAKLATPRTADLIRIAISSGLGRGDDRLGRSFSGSTGGGNRDGDSSRAG